MFDQDLGLLNPAIHEFKDGKQFRKVLDKQYKRLRANVKTNPARFSQFLVFKSVTTETLRELDTSSELKSVRISHYPESQLLVVKIMPSIPHEGAHRELGRDIERAIEKMELKSSAFYCVGGGRYFNTSTGVAKEADTAYVPFPRRKKWPTLVIESGMSEFLACFSTS